jgi:8-oxo-dGTP pyrophosphatase MutT (NUDIX family)
MKIREQTIINGKVYDLEYIDADNFNDLPKEKCTQHYGVCFINDKFIIGKRGDDGEWGLIGGTIEKGEDFGETLVREVKEEANARVIKWIPIGYQKTTNPQGEWSYQLRSCCLVELIGDFQRDLDGSIIEIAFADRYNYKKYFNWGRIGERIIERAYEIKRKLEEQTSDGH